MIAMPAGAPGFRFICRQRCPWVSAGAGMTP